MPSKVFISHRSALDFWRTHDLSRSGGIERVRSGSLVEASAALKVIKPLVRSASPTSGRIYGARDDGSLASALSDLTISELPLHVMIADRSKRRKTSDLVTHLYEDGLPEGSLCRIAESVLVSSPELTLAQLAVTSSFVDLLELALEFCGGYVLNESSERGFDDRPALTNAVRLASFVKRFRGHHGVKRLRSILPYVVDGSASPMESSALMLLCLPSKLGGFQLPLPEHNVEIPISERIRSRTKRKKLVCDLYWKAFRLDVECDSTMYHSSKEQLGIDSDRRIVLDAMGYAYVGVTRYQLEHEDEFQNVVRSIRRAMGLRLRGAIEGRVEENRKLLREYLVTPHGERRPLKLV